MANETGNNQEIGGSTQQVASQDPAYLMARQVEKLENQATYTTKKARRCHQEEEVAMDGARVPNETRQNCKSCSNLDTTTRYKKARTTPYRLTTNSEARHQTRRIQLGTSS